MTEGHKLQQTHDQKSEKCSAPAEVETTRSVEQPSSSHTSSTLVTTTTPTTVPTLARELFFQQYLTPAGMEVMNSYLRGQCNLNDSSPVSADV